MVNLQSAPTTGQQVVNVATNSSNGHFMHAKEVVNVDHLEQTFTCFVDGEATLTTENHGEIKVKEDCTVFHQDALNPLTQQISKRVD